MKIHQIKEGYYIKLLRFFFEDASNPYVPQYIENGSRFYGPDIIYVKCSQAFPHMLTIEDDSFENINKKTLQIYNTWKNNKENVCHQIKEGYYIKLLRFFFEDASNPYVPQYIENGSRFYGPDIIYVKCSQAFSHMLTIEDDSFKNINKKTLQIYNTWKKSKEKHKKL